MATPTRPSAGYSVNLTVEISDAPGTLARLLTVIGQCGASIEAVQLIGKKGPILWRKITVKCADDLQGERVARATEHVSGVELVAVCDRTFALHQGGKLAVAPRVPVATMDDLAMAYTPGVGRIVRAIASEPDRVWELTAKGNSVAILTDGTAVLGLGAVGPEAAMPVMEGKALLFKTLADIDAFPISLRTASSEAIIEVAKAIAPGFGGINLEDVAAPACFAVEERLQSELEIPVFHDDQHATAVVILAAVLNAARVVEKSIHDLRIVVLGLGAAGIACIKLLLASGVRDVVGVDRAGVLGRDMSTEVNAYQRWIGEHTNRDNVKGGLADALPGADVFIGLSGPNLVEPHWVSAMAERAIVFALANPVPEIMPEDVPDNVAVMATGRSDYPNQINNVLVFPGFFRGLLDCRARGVNDNMKLAAATALADLVPSGELARDEILPSAFDNRVVPTIAAAVREAAAASRSAQTLGRPQAADL